LALPAGKRLGPYEIVAPLGAGGMGEVYRAKDTRLDREVAVKILPADFASNPQLKARFEREAKTISQLSHPNVCSLFDVGSEAGTDYLVMELIDGESLGDRLQKGPLGIESVLKHGIEIASALDAAHRQGIVHRDLKPGNVMLTKAGAKLLDFGLAKAGPLVSGTASESRLAESPTVYRPLTEQGMILGTFQYMAPEQLEGLEADARSDIFAFGALLYQMATGQPAFQGKTRTSLIAAIVSGVPQPVSQLAPMTPPALDHLIHDAGSRAGEAAPVLAKRRARARFGWVANAVTALVAVLATAGVLWTQRTPPKVVRSSLLPPGGTQFVPISGAMALSPDGRRMAFVARDDGGKEQLWIRALDALTAQPLAGSEGASHPFWSPDSRYVAFFSGGKLRKIDANGGPPQALCDASAGRGGTWGEDGTILFTPSPADTIYRVAAAGGAPVAVTEFDAEGGELSHRFPEFLPDGRHFLFLVQGRAETEGSEEGFTLFAGSLESKERKRLVATSSSARYAKSGHVLFLRDRTLLAQRFDAGALELVGDAVPVAENLSRTTRFETMFSLSDAGFLAFQAGAESELSQLVWVDRAGRDLETVGKPADYRSIALSHDGKRVAAAVVDSKSGKSDVWILDLDRGTSTRLTFDPADETAPIWTPDDRRVYFTSTRQGRGDIYVKSSSGTGTEEVVLADPDASFLWSVSVDGRIGAVMTNSTSKRTAWDVSILDLASGQARVFLDTPFSELTPAVSSNGRWLAYTSNESGQNEVYVQSLAGDGGKWQVSAEGGTRARWTRDDRELIFQTPDFKLVIVDVESTSEFRASVPRPLVDARIRQIIGMHYAVSPDGARILVNRALEQAEVAPVTLVQNWALELER
jgi:serine/threonine protein kinase